MFRRRSGGGGRHGKPHHHRLRSSIIGPRPRGLGTRRNHLQCGLLSAGGGHARVRHLLCVGVVHWGRPGAGNSHCVRGQHPRLRHDVPDGLRHPAHRRRLRLDQPHSTPLAGGLQQFCGGCLGAHRCGVLGALFRGARARASHGHPWRRDQHQRAGRLWQRGQRKRHDRKVVDIRPRSLADYHSRFRDVSGHEGLVPGAERLLDHCQPRHLPRLRRAAACLQFWLRCELQYLGAAIHPQR